MFLHPCHSAPPKDCGCYFSVSAPGLNDPCWMNDAFNLYAMEYEEEREEEINEETYL